MKHRVLAAAIVLALPTRAIAQGGSGTFSADAVVVTVGMTIATIQDLSFGTVFQGTVILSLTYL